MKKILALVCFLIAVAACATQPPGNKDTMSNANKGGEMKSTAAPSEAGIIAKEKAGWDAIKKKDWDALGKMLASSNRIPEAEAAFRDMARRRPNDPRVQWELGNFLLEYLKKPDGVIVVGTRTYGELGTSDKLRTTNQVYLRVK